MTQIKTITIDQLKPGMFIVGMDQPWYRTPFLLHKRLIRDTKDIALLRQHGIRELKIDPSQGLDAEPNPPGDGPPTSNTEGTAAALRPNLAGKPASPEKVPQSPASVEVREMQPPSPGTQKDKLPLNKREATATPQLNHAVQPLSPEQAPLPAVSVKLNATQPLQPVRQEDTPRSSKAREQAAAAQETYREAACSMERMFEELEAGTVPRPDTLRTVVGNMLSRVLDDGASMLNLLSLQKMKRFDRTLASHALDVCTLALIVAHDYGIAEGDLEALGAGA